MIYLLHAWLCSCCRKKTIILLFSSLQIPVPNLISFAEALEVGYSKYKNPYHNLIHAADVTQTVHYIMIHTGIMVRSIVKFNFLLFSDSAVLNKCVHVSFLKEKAQLKILQRGIQNYCSGCELYFILTVFSG